MYRKNIETLPNPKVLTGDLVQYNKLSFDDAGIMAPHNVSVYAIMLPAEDRYTIAGLLNSALIEFYHKQHSRVHVGKAYRYIKDHTSQWPIVRPTAEPKSVLEDHVRDILRLKDLEIKVPQFPDPYIAAAREEGREFVTVEYTPSSSHEASPSIQPDLAGDYVIEVGDDRIEEGIVDTETKAEYLAAALDGTRLTAGDSVSVPVPLDDDVARSALDELAADRATQQETSITAIEAEIDEIVFELFEIDSERHREMIRRYNGQYETVRRIDPGQK